MRDFEVSRTTIRQAIMELVQEKRLVRKRGKGTFVSEPAILTNMIKYSTFAEEMDDLGKNHKAVLIKKRVIKANEQLSRDLNIPLYSEVYEMIRLRLGDNEPLVIRISFIPKEIHPSLFEKNLEQMPLYEILKNDCGIIIGKVCQTFQAVLARSWEAEKLSVKIGSPLILSTGIVYDDQNNKPIEWVKTLFRGDRYRFYIEQNHNYADENNYR